MQSSSCSCAIGKMGTCGHITGLLHTLAHMKSSNLKSVPSDILKTSSPQTWHMPRGQKLKGNAIDDFVVLGYDSHSPYRPTRGLRSTLFNPIKFNILPIEDLCSAVGEIDEQCLLLSVAIKASDMVETKFGKYPKEFPLSYQQKLSSHYILNLLDNDLPSLPLENYTENESHLVLDERKSISFNAIVVTVEERQNIEAMTRLQSSDLKWHAVRKDRLTASVASDIVNRSAGFYTSWHL